MKAIDFAKKFNESKDVFGTIGEFVKDGISLISDRTRNSASENFTKAAIAGALREMRSRWQAVQRHSPQLAAFSFDQIAKQIKQSAPTKFAKYI